MVRGALVGARGLPGEASDRRPLGRALVAMPDTFRVVALSRALLSMGLLPSVAFSSTEVFTYLTVDAFSVLVLHRALLGPTPRAFLARALRGSRVPVLFVGASPPGHTADTDGLPADDHAPDGLPPDAVAAMALSLASEAATWPRVLQWGPLRMDVGRREAWWAARRLPLTSMQFRLLATLVLAEGCVVPTLEVSRRAFGSAVAHDGERVHAHVRRIRKLIEADPSNPRFLLTVRGEGFRLANYIG
jgi:DNA-binding response OmpR family regulator